MDLAEHRYAGRSHRVAHFAYDNARFVLIPGQELQLGYDAQRFQPSHAQLESYQASAEEYELDADIASFVAQMTRPPQTTSLSAFLLEVAPKELGLEPIGPDDPEIRRILAEYSSQEIEVYKRYRVRRNQDGTNQRMAHCSAQPPGYSA